MAVVQDPSPVSIPKFTIQHDSGEEGVVEHSDEEFFDANDEVPVKEEDNSDNHCLQASSLSTDADTCEDDPPEIEIDKDYSEIDNVEGNISNNKSMILRLLSQIRIGMDVTRIVLPAFIFEKRSILELSAEFFTHPNIIINAPTYEDPLDRMMEVTRWFLSAISASRKIGVPKKPYNPVLGEVFTCYWDVPGGKRTAPNGREKAILDSGPPILPGYDSLSFLSEQVSHHPPVSAFYAECASKRVYINATVEMKTKFLGLSVKLQNNGLYELYFLDRNEVYCGSFPNGYVRSILTTPWFEFGGPVTITCKETGYTCHLDFHTKPFRGGHRDRVTGDIRHTSRKKAIFKLEGFWTNVISKKMPNHTTEPFFDASTMPITRKKVKKFSLQDAHESRVVWRHLTAALEREDSEAASIAKHEVEEAQRAKAREFKFTGMEWEARHFNYGTKNGMPFWIYKNTLKDRLQATPQS